MSGSQASAGAIVDEFKKLQAEGRLLRDIVLPWATQWWGTRCADSHHDCTGCRAWEGFKRLFDLCEEDDATLPGPWPAGAIWQHLGDDQWVFGVPVRGVVRHRLAEVYFDEHRNLSWVWFLHKRDDQDAEAIRGATDKLAWALALAEDAMRVRSATRPPTEPSQDTPHA